MKRILLLTVVYVSGLVITDVKQKPDSGRPMEVKSVLDDLKIDEGVKSKAYELAYKRFPNNKHMRDYHAKRILSAWGINKLKQTL